MKPLTKKQMLIGLILFIIALGIAGTDDCNLEKSREKNWKESCK